MTPETPKTYPAFAHPRLAILLYVLAIGATATAFVGGVIVGDRSASAGWLCLGSWSAAALGLVVVGRAYTFLWRCARALERLSPPPVLRLGTGEEVPSQSTSADTPPATGH